MSSRRRRLSLVLPNVAGSLLTVVPSERAGGRPTRGARQTSRTMQRQDHVRVRVRRTNNDRVGPSGKSSEHLLALLLFLGPLKAVRRRPSTAHVLPRADGLEGGLAPVERRGERVGERGPVDKDEEAAVRLGDEARGDGAVGGGGGGARRGVGDERVRGGKPGRGGSVRCNGEDTRAGDAIRALVDELAQGRVEPIDVEQDDGWGVRARD